ncbi:uncharacterized protein LOC143117426 [Alosa pseudoharengus]|uniref:uncharacterized protein LOC143117426 n=1 Tax=Alosa pseudoharengus TaxID=34774 RepID=UPI003F88F886
MAAEGPQASRGDISNLIDLRIVLLGNRDAWRSSAGNTILGREEFDPDVRTLQCVKRQGEVAGRQVTVVDTPGWKDYSECYYKDSPNLLKQEIVLSVTLCPPGPHAFLLVIHENMTFKEAERKATSNHLSLLGHGAWKHSLVLFIQETPAEEKAFEVKGKMLQQLVDNCGKRYHVLNIKNKDKMQVTELLEKIDKMVAGNSNSHYEMDRQRLEEVEEKRRKDKEKGTRTAISNRSSTENTCPLSEFRVVLLGYRTSGKSSSGNTILGREEFDLKRRTAQCVKRQGEVTGRQVTVVEAPGWWINFNLKTSLELTKQEIVFSVSLCPPGPHIFLLIVKIAEASTQDYIINIQEHLEFFSDRVWSNTMVLFTRGDWLGDTTIEQYIESEEHIRYLVEKCGNRYHVLNNEDKSDKTQITELMEKMEEIISGNGGRHYEMDRKRLEEVKERREKEEERATERLMKVERQRRHLQSRKQNTCPLSEFRVVLLGYRTSGKSSSGNTILGREEFDLKRRTAQCVKRQGEVAGRQVTVVEAPGWWKNISLKNTPELTKQEIVLSVSLCPPGPHILLLLIKVADSYSQDDIRNTQEHLEFLSGRVWSHTMVLFTRGDWLGNTTIEQYIESEEHLRYLVEKCGNRYHVLNNQDKSDRTQITELMEKMEEIISGNMDGHFEMNRKRLEEVKERRKQQTQRAEDRQMCVYRQRSAFQFSGGDGLFLSSMRVVLLGYRTSGKSSSGNTILGREEFDLKRTAQCVKRQGEVAGRQVTVVEAPGWWKNISLKNTPELTKQEIVLSVSLCPPGPHILLLLIQVADSYSQDDIRNTQEHLEFLSDRVWSHTMVLFTCGDWLGDTTIEQYIESEEHIRYLVEKCGNRYHVLNNENKSDKTQITELMEKIEEIISGNSGHHFEMNRKRLEKVKERRKQQTQRAEDRQMCVYKQRSAFQFSGGDGLFLSSMRVVLLGYRTSGKSSSGNTILGREEFDLKRRTAQCVKRQGEVAGRQVTVVKAPGWFSLHNLTDTPELTKQEIVQSVSQCPPGPHTVLLVIRTDYTLAEAYTKSVRGHLELLGKHVWSHTIVLFTYGDWLGDTSIEQYIESEGETLQWIIGKCGNRYHVLNNKDWTDDTQVTELLEKIEQLVVRNGGAHYQRPQEEEKKEEKKEGEKEEEKKEKMRRRWPSLFREQMTRAERTSSPLSELRVVLLGFKYAGKSSTGNTILGREEFQLGQISAVCVKRHREVAGRQVTVVEAPGWWSHYQVEYSAEMTKRAIQLCPGLCDQGPHVFLLVIRADISFTEAQRISAQQHLELLSERVWRYTILLFTRGDWLGDTPIEQYIESEGEALKWLTEKCGNRYHVLNNHNSTDGRQATELLEKIEEMVAGNGSSHFKMNKGLLRVLEEREKMDKIRAEERMMKLKQQRHDLRSSQGESSPLSEFRFVLMGSIGSGKSSSGNTILGREEFDLNRRTAQCVKRQGEVAGRQVTVVKAPGWWKNLSPIETKELTKQEIVFSVSLCPPGPHILLLILQVGKHYTEDDRRIIQQHMELISERVWNHTMVLFTHGDWLGNVTIEQHIESEEALQSLVEKCGNRYHVLNNQNSRDDMQIKQLLEKIEEMVAGNGGRHFEVDKTTLQAVKKNRNVEEYIESEGEALQWLVEKCGNKYVHWTGEESWPGVLKKVDELVFRNGGIHFQYEEKRTNKTTAADWKMEVQQLEDLKEENELGKSSKTPLMEGATTRLDKVPPQN